MRKVVPISDAAAATARLVEEETAERAGVPATSMPAPEAAAVASQLPAAPEVPAVEPQESPGDTGPSGDESPDVEDTSRAVSVVADVEQEVPTTEEPPTNQVSDEGPATDHDGGAHGSAVETTALVGRATRRTVDAAHAAQTAISTTSGRTAGNRPLVPGGREIGDSAAVGIDPILDEITHPVSVYILPNVLAAAVRMREQHGELNSSIATKAIDKVHKEGWLQRLVYRRNVVPRGEDSLFPDRRASRRTKSRRNRQPSRVLWQIKLNAAECAVVDSLRMEYGASSRSELISVAVEAYFLPPTEEELREWKRLDNRALGAQDLDEISPQEDTTI